MRIILIAIIKSSYQNKNISGFRLLDVDSGECKDINYNSVVSTIQNQGLEVEGIDISTGIPKGSNGSFDRYTQLVEGLAISKCPLVIVKEYPNKVYDVTNHLGKIAKMGIKDIIQFAENEGIANGKIINGEYISSICGEYVKDKSFKDIAYGDKLQSKMNMLGISGFDLDKDYYAFGTEKEITELQIGRGCLGITEKGFKGFDKLKIVQLHKTCTNFKQESFSGCKQLVTINIPEGTVIIPSRCFENCVSLQRVSLPNSIRVIENNAFRGCNSLKEISLGPVRPNVSALSFTRNAKKIIRK